MEIRTRLSPTANGKLHLGHTFTMLVNEYFAHSRNGKFFVRFDDDCPPVTSQPAELTSKIILSQIEDIQWMDVEVDDWSYQTQMTEEVIDTLNELGYIPIPEVKDGEHKLPLHIRMGTKWIPFPYVIKNTVDRVVMDHVQGITHVIRGDDFSTEYSLYLYLCQRFGYPFPEFVFLPRLESIYGDISKTNGGYKISDYRNSGYTPDQVKKMIAKASLYYPNNGFEFYNIKPNPRLDF